MAMASAYPSLESLVQYGFGDLEGPADFRFCKRTKDMKPSQNSLFKVDTYVRSIAESRILGLVHI
jgi:hypothetical protein